MEARKFLPLLTLVIMLTLSAVIWFYPPTGDFRIDNPFWNGLTTLSNQTNVIPLDSLSNLPSTTKGTALLIIPYNQFTEPELAQVKNYVSTGGTLILLDDYGFGNQVLSALGTNMKFTGQPLLDPLFDYRNKWLPKITDFTSTPMGTNVSSIVFNHASTLDTTSDATVVAYSSSFSFLDTNNNGAWDANETSGPLPVAAYVKIGQGYVVAAADPSLLINSMINLDDNLQFVNNITGIQSANPQLFVDQAHLPKAPLDDAKASLAVVYGAVASPLGTLGLIAVILAISLKPIYHKVKK